MHSIRIKITAITMAAILVCILVLGGLGIHALQTESDRSSAEEMNLISENVQELLDAYLNSIKQSMSMANNVAEDSLANISLQDYGVEPGGVSPTQTAAQAAGLEAILSRHCDMILNAFSSVANHTSGVVTYYYCINPDVCPTMHGFFYSKVGLADFEEQPPLDARELDPSDIEHTTWYYTPIRRGSPTWVGPYTAHFLDERWTVSYVVPVYKDSILIGVMGMDILFETMTDQIKDISVFDTGFVCLLDSKATVYYHPYLEIGTVPEQSNQLQESESFQRSGSSSAPIRYTADGEERQLAFSTLSNGMKAVVVAPVSEITDSSLHLVQSILIVSVVILIVSALVILIAMRAVTKPLLTLASASKQLAAGDYDVKLDYAGKDEVGVLTDSFRTMRDHLRLHISDLNSRAYTDALTGIRNKGAFDIAMGRLGEQIERGSEGAMPEFGIVVLDCNRLKQTNDDYGHNRGDEYLKIAVSTICQVFSHSPVFRVGGDEFVVILQDQDYANRDELMDAFDRNASRINAGASNPWEQVNVSKGLAVFEPATDTSAEQVFNRADELMYENKRRYKDSLG